jgi:hypothetical protein
LNRDKLSALSVLVLLNVINNQKQLQQNAHRNKEGEASEQAYPSLDFVWIHTWQEAGYKYPSLNQKHMTA